MTKSIGILNAITREIGPGEGILRRIWCRSKIAPALVACASQRRRPLEEGDAATWQIDALLPLAVDGHGIPSHFRLILPLKVGKDLGFYFTYAAMMERMERNYGPFLDDPLKRVPGHYEDERRRRARGMVTYAEPSRGDSLSSESWAQRATLK